MCRTALAGPIVPSAFALCCAALAARRSRSFFVLLMFYLHRCRGVLSYGIPCAWSSHRDVRTVTDGGDAGQTSPPVGARSALRTYGARRNSRPGRPVLPAGAVTRYPHSSAASQMTVAALQSGTLAWKPSDDTRALAHMCGPSFQVHVAALGLRSLARVGPKFGAAMFRARSRRGVYLGQRSDGPRREGTRVAS
jgi:hypothetical protein